MKNEIHKKVEEALQGLENIERAEANPFLYQKVLHRLENAGRTTVAVINTRWVWGFAAAFALLLAINVWVGTAYKKQDNMAQRGIQQVVNEYNLQDDFLGY